MTRMPTVAQRAEDLLGSPVVATTPVAGGDICVATRLRLTDGRSALVKTRPQAPAGFFASEAEGLHWLAQVDGVSVPDVLAVEEDCLILAWVEQGRPGAESASDFGRALARTHAAGAEVFGRADGREGFIGTLPLPHRPTATWPEFFAVRRLLPYLKLAADRGAIETRDASSVEAVVQRVVTLAGPAEPPARLHGDLWSGNVLWGAAGAGGLPRHDASGAGLAGPRRAAPVAPAAGARRALRRELRAPRRRGRAHPALGRARATTALAGWRS